MMINLKKGIFVGLLTFVTIGCSDPEPQVIDMDELAAEAGLSEDEYVIHENGAIEVKAPEEAVKAESPTALASDQPLAATGKDWEYIVKNGIRTADAYAVENNPASAFIGKDLDVQLDKQYGGKYEGEYLLTILNDNKGSVSYAQLRPLFDINESSDELDDESQLWEVTMAKFNGQEF